MNYARVNWVHLMTLRPVDRVAAMVTMQAKMDDEKAQKIVPARKLIASPNPSQVDLAGLKFGSVIVAGWIPASSDNIQRTSAKKSSGSKRAQWLCFCTKCGVDSRHTSRTVRRLTDLDGCFKCYSDPLYRPAAQPVQEAAHL